jgi:hypothetical protein
MPPGPVTGGTGGNVYTNGAGFATKWHHGDDFMIARRSLSDALRRLRNTGRNRWHHGFGDRLLAGAPRCGTRTARAALVDAVKTQRQARATIEYHDLERRIAKAARPWMRRRVRVHGGMAGRGFRQARP